MHYFVALLWNPASGGQSSTASHLSKCFANSNPFWRSVIHAKGLSLFRPADQACAASGLTLPRDRGSIVGTLFRRDNDNELQSRVTSIDDPASARMVSTAGATLVREFWGGYVAFLRSPEGSHHVIRDCSGAVPCYRITVEDVDVVFSDLEGLKGLPLPALSINYKYLSAFVVASEFQNRECGFNEITELLAGDCFSRQGEARRQYSIWKPSEFCDHDHLIDDPVKASELLQGIARSCIGSWAGVYERILLRLSGGLDSAVVLGCLASLQKKPQITGLHLLTRDSDEDETHYARLAAERANVPLIEIPAFPEECAFDEQLVCMPQTPKPLVSHVYGMLRVDSENEVASQVQAQAVWTGQGGDHLFCQMAEDLFPADYLRYRLPSIDFIRTAMDSARLARKSYWAILRKAWLHGYARVPWRPDNDIPRKVVFVSPKHLPSDLVDYISQPWSSETDGVADGKRLQIRFLCEVVNRHRPLPRVEYASEHHPLLSQPLMELCMRIPTYTLLRGGVDRSLARTAFRSYVPAQIVDRHGKGLASTTHMSKVRQSEHFLQTILLDGVLVRKGIVDPRDIEPYLMGQPVSVDTMWPLFSCIAAEVWLRAASESALRVAA